MNEQKAFRENVRIAKSSQWTESPTAGRLLDDQLERDARPGHFTVRGAFINLDDVPAIAPAADEQDPDRFDPHRTRGW